MTVIIHSLADAALADGPHRHPPTRSLTLPSISTLIPAASLPTRASRSSPPKLSSRDQTLLSPPSVKGWSSVTFSSNDTTAPLMLPGSHTVHRPIEAQIHPLTQVTNQHMPLEYRKTMQWLMPWILGRSPMDLEPTPPSCHPTKSIVLCTENEWSSSITRSATNHPASRLNVTAYRSDSHQSSQSPFAPKAAFEELDSTSSSSSCSSELSEYEEKGGEDFPIKLRLRAKVSHLPSILGSSTIKSIGSENVTPSSPNYTPTNNTKRARTLNSTSTSSPMPLSSWSEERGNGVVKDCTGDNGVECTDNTGGKVEEEADGGENAYGTIGQMATDLESANATTSKLQKQLAERDSLVSDLQSELSLYKRKFGECTLI
ncbi:hypothetical protein I312_102508 [Cryptococcus bacillisporus CA1280]|uniref:uncharacterized protein n=1 Tax=Cryptococcus bacillisporus CA1280 TaxID=1296109 RepID=UPI00336878B0